MGVFRVCKVKGSARLSADTPMPAGQNVIPVDELTWSEGDVGFLPGVGFQVGRAGLYLVLCSLSRAAVAAASQMQVRLFINGAAPADVITVVNPSTSAVITNQSIDLQPLNAGDTVSLVGTLSSSATVNARRIGTKLVVARIGPERWT